MGTFPGVDLTAEKTSGEALYNVPEETTNLSEQTSELTGLDDNSYQCTLPVKSRRLLDRRAVPFPERYNLPDGLQKDYVQGIRYNVFNSENWTDFFTNQTEPVVDGFSDYSTNAVLWNPTVERFADLLLPPEKASSISGELEAAVKDSNRHPILAPHRPLNLPCPGVDQSDDASNKAIEKEAFEKEAFQTKKTYPVLPETLPYLISPESRQDLTDEGALDSAALSGFHCDICKKEIGFVNAPVESSKDCFRIRCAECSEFDLCTDCFLRGLESTQSENTTNSHYKFHAYIPIGTGDFPLFTLDWTADEEFLLIDGVSKCGFGNWNDVADIVNGGSRKKIKPKTGPECEKHYLNVYVFSPVAPLPDTSDVVSFLDSDGKIKQNSKSHTGMNRGVEEERLLRGNTNKNLTDCKPVSCSGSAPQLLGYWPLRGDFDVEPDNEAELILADMEFRENELAHEKELKLQIIEIYNSRLDERIYRKRTVIERGLLDLRAQQQKEKKRTKEEKELHNLLRPLARFHSEAQHERFIQLLIEERNIRNRFIKLAEWRTLGLSTFDEVKQYENQKRKREEIISLKRAQYNFQFEAGHRHQRRNRSTKNEESTTSNQKNMASSSPTYGSSPTNNLTKWPGVNCLSNKETKLCENLSISPIHYLLLKHALVTEARSRGIINMQDRSKDFKIEGKREGQLCYLALSSEASDAGDDRSNQSIPSIGMIKHEPINKTVKLPFKPKGSSAEASSIDIKGSSNILLNNISSIYKYSKIATRSLLVSSSVNSIPFSKTEDTVLERTGATKK